MLLQQLAIQKGSPQFQSFFDAFFNAWIIISQIVGFIVILGMQLWWASVIFVLTFIPSFVISYRFGQKSYDLDKEMSKIDRRVRYISEVLTGRDSLEERYMYGYTSKMNEEYKNMYEYKRIARKKVSKSLWVNTTLASMLTFVSGIIVIAVLIPSAIFPNASGEIALSVGMLVAIVNAILGLSDIQDGISDNFYDFKYKFEYLKDLNTFLTFEESEGAGSLPDTHAFVLNSIEFKNVSFKYPGCDSYILKNFNITLHSGKHYAIVGANGAGKTTLVKILTGLYDNYEGDILINGKDLRSYTMSELKALSAIVYQDFSRYPLDFYHNIAIGNINDMQNREKVENAVKIIGLSEAFDKLPNGFETPITKVKENGVDMSGGEWQRIALARLLVNPAPLKILDEPTAALDPISESRVYEQFGNIVKHNKNNGNITIFISHRLGSTTLADEIIVISEGQVAEVGTFDELISNGGIYAEMFEKQAEWYREGYLQSEIHKKSALIDPIEYENPKHLDDINKATAGISAAINFNIVTSFIVNYHLPYFIFMILYLNKLKPMLILCLLFAFIPVFISHILRSSVLSKLEDKSAPIRREYEAYNDAACGKDFYKETRTLGAFVYLKKLLTNSINSLNAAIWSAKKRNALIDIGFNTLSLMGYGGVLFLSVKYLFAGEISIGAFAAVFSSIDMLFSTMEYLIGFHLSSIANNLGMIRNLLRFLNIPSDDRINCNLNKKAEIKIENATFRYPNSNMDSLKNINLIIQPGETIAIVGKNGAGKTTLVKLLTGLYKPNQGSVKIGGKDLSEISYKSLFENISGVSQKYQRYALTLRDNIQIADFTDTGNDNKVEKLLEENHIDKDDKAIFPDGLDTMLSREFDGVDLSGGQWQRIAIARGFYRNSDIIVLDEPTAAIDPIEESSIYKKFIEVARNKTTIIVTHRMGSAKIAERIIVMKDGEIAEIGSHDELLKRRGVYAEMYEAQAKWYN